MNPGSSSHAAHRRHAPESTLCAMLEHAVATVPETVALRHCGAELTYRELGRAVTALARRLSAIVNPGTGDVVALALPNSIEFFIAYFATLRALAAPALISPIYPAIELARLLREAAPRVVLCGTGTRDIVLGLAGDLQIPGVVCLGADVTVAELVNETSAPLDLRLSTADETGVLLFTGGTTGSPKAVEHSHSRLTLAVRSMEHIWPTHQDGEVFLAIAPFTHVYGFLQGVLVPVSARGETIISERFKPEHIVELLDRHRVTFFGGGPPAIYAGVLAAGNLKSADLSALRVCAAGGAPFPLELMERWRRATRLGINEGYGMSEIAPISGADPVSGVRPSSVGKPVPGTEVQVMDLETGRRVLSPGEKGEIRVRGPHMMKGYRDRADETAETLRDGFIYTGDIGYLDEDGFLFITDRKKDVAFVKGFNVFPREVEEVIHTHPSVCMVGVVGLPDSRTGGERLAAFVVCQSDEVVSGAEISAYCASRLVSHKRPSGVYIVDRLPMTGNQKLDRIALRQMAERLTPPVT